AAPIYSLFPYTTLFRSVDQLVGNAATVRLVAAVVNGLLDPFHARSVYFRQLTQTLFYSLQLLGLIAQTDLGVAGCRLTGILGAGDRKSTRLNSSHVKIS